MGNSKRNYLAAKESKIVEDSLEDRLVFALKRDKFNKGKLWKGIGNA